MAVELEAKMSVEAFDPVRARLREAGATRVGDHFELNTFFDTPSRALTQAKHGLRLRVQRDGATGAERSVVTWKGRQHPGPLKSREEVEFVASPGSAAALLFERLGYVRTFSFEKRRETWRLDACTVELDELPLLGKFVEIEGPDEQDIFAIRARIGLSDHPIIKAGYVGLLKDHLSGAGPNQTNDVKFPNTAHAGA
jgi:adenylate cyclase class 2